MTSICVGVFFYGRPSASRFLERKLRKELYVCSTRYRSLRWGFFCCVGERVVWKCFGALQMTTIFRCTSVNPRPPHKVSPEARAGTLAAGVRLYTTAFHARATQLPSNPRSAASSCFGCCAKGMDSPLYVGQPTTDAQGRLGSH